MTRQPHSRHHDALTAAIAATAVIWAVLLTMLLTDTDPAPEPPSEGAATPDADRVQRADTGSRGTARTAPPRHERTPPPGDTDRDRARTVVHVGKQEPTSPGGRWPWDALAECESGGNPAAVSPSGTYRGMFQFSIPTWLSVGGTGDPAQASAAEQLRRAKILQARSGFGQWPQCAARLGLTS